MRHFLKIIHSPCGEWVYVGSILFVIYVQAQVKKGQHQQKLHSPKENTAIDFVKSHEVTE